MEEFVARENIHRYEQMLRAPRDEAQVKLLKTLLAEERAKLAAILARQWQQAEMAADAPAVPCGSHSQT